MTTPASTAQRMVRSARAEAAELRSSLGLYRRMLPDVRAQWRVLAVTVAAMLGETLVTLAQPWPLKVIVDSVLGNRPAPALITSVTGPLNHRSLLWVTALLLLVIVVTLQLLGLATQYLSQLLGQRLVLQLRCRLWSRLQRLSLTFHDNNSTGDLIYRVTGDAAALQDVVTYGFVPLAVQLLTVVAISVAIFTLDFQLGLIAVASLPVLVVWTIWSSGRVKRQSRGLARADSRLYTTVSEVLGSVRAVKAQAAEDLEIDRFQTRARASQDEYVRVMAMSTVSEMGTSVLAELGVAAVVVVGAFAVLRGRLTVGDLLVFVAYLRSLYGPVAQVAGSAMVLQRSGASIERVIEVLDHPEERVVSGSDALRRIEGRIRFDGVTFAYGDRGSALANLDLEIAPGEMVALVGRSGAGKTTLASLLLRFYVPQTGRILLDGVDAATFDLSWLRRQVALVLQDPIIFSASLAENVAYGRPEANRHQIEEAARAAGMHEFIAGLPDGYDTQVGERGVRLSGGQRQRLSIARAFLKDAPIVVLDEPTSSLDATTERHIFESLERLAHGRTTVVIAHRLATARRADRIVVLEDGGIAEQGTHAQLMRRRASYRRLHDDQAVDLTTRAAKAPNAELVLGSVGGSARPGADTP
jgi:ABC-type multidrug transport system fused ATPase/permease subunit